MNSHLSPRIEVLTSAEALRAHEAAWRELGTRLLEPNPTYRPEFLMPGLKAFPAAVSFVLVYEGMKLQGLFPLMRHGKTWKFFRHPYSPLQTPWVGDAAAIVSFWDWITASDARVLELEQVPVGGRVYALLVDEAFRRALLSWVGDTYARAVFTPHPQGHEAYLRTTIGTERRKKFRNLRKRLDAQGGLVARQLLAGDDLSPWLRDFLALEASGWKGRAGTAASQSPVTHEFVESVFRGFHGRGDLEMIGLELRGRLIAIKCNLWDGDAAYTYKIAYDEQHAALSPGAQLELENIRLAHEAGARPLRALDSCTAPGNFRFKHLWNDRILIETRMISTGRIAGDWAVTRRPLLRFASRLKLRLVSHLRRRSSK